MTSTVLPRSSPVSTLMHSPMLGTRSVAVVVEDSRSMTLRPHSVLVVVEVRRMRLSSSSQLSAGGLAEPVSRETCAETI